MNTDSLLAIFNYQFTQNSLLEQALTHRSFSRDNNNERLEFLGDSVLSLVISQHIYHELSNSDEGDLSRVRASLVKEHTLAEIARSINLGDYIKLGGGELKSGGFRRSSILSDTLEAIIGAIYLDSDYDQARKSILFIFRDYLKTLPDAQALKDPKTCLQEILQSRQITLPRYEVTQTSGKDHHQIFTVKCSIPDLTIETTGRGSSRKKAEQAAADNALKRL